MTRSGLVLALLSGAVLSSAAADDREYQQAQFDYQLHCQGCHTPDGSGADSVPRMKNEVGVFLQSKAGREYLVRVPGSATSALNDKRLASVLNWMVREFAGDSVTGEFQPYSSAEVSELRQQPLNEVDKYRAELLQALTGATGRKQ
ncbi:c-type cytochrome [Parahaliea mediterranea]|uniref:c-type cytochrome n=1 Tax=Parahaliea mediterranea TaxID=651086 RepID=UPI0019D46737|nr:cytochrome c, class I [Parahaliea mediterranea]